MKVFQSASPRFALSVCTLLLSACTNPGYNDNPSQQITRTWVGCPVVTDFFGVYFSVRVQPLTPAPDAKVTKEMFRAYCHDIPMAGRVYFTADVTDAVLNHKPIGIQVVEQEFLGGDESRDENFRELRTLAEVPSQVYPRGVIETQFDLDKDGRYAVLLTRGAANAGSPKDKLRIPLNVGADSGATPVAANLVTLAGIVLGTALAGFTAFRFRQRRKGRRAG